MVLVISRNGWEFKENINPEVSVDSNVCTAITKSKELRLQILNELNVNVLAIGLLGVKSADGVFVKPDNQTTICKKINDIKTKMEYGYYGKV